MLPTEAQIATHWQYCQYCHWGAWMRLGGPVPVVKQREPTVPAS